MRARDDWREPRILLSSCRPVLFSFMHPATPLEKEPASLRREITPVQLAARLGFARVANLAGGIDRWSLDVDPAARRY